MPAKKTSLAAAIAPLSSDGERAAILAANVANIANFAFNADANGDGNVSTGEVLNVALRALPDGTAIFQNIAPVLKWWTKTGSFSDKKKAIKRFNEIAQLKNEDADERFEAIMLSLVTLEKGLRLAYYGFTGKPVSGTDDEATA